MVDLLTNQKLTWKQTSTRDDGQVFESKPLDRSDDPELLHEVNEARTALIEQVCHGIYNSIKRSKRLNVQDSLLQSILFPVTGC